MRPPEFECERRSVISMVAALGSAAIGGCVSAITNDADEPPVEHPGYPEFPGQLTEESVEEYVREYERAAQYDRQLTDDVTSINMVCAARVEFASDGSWYVSASCDGSRTERDSNGRESVGDFGQYGVGYRITTEETIRTVPDSHRYRDPLTNSETNRRLSELYAFNFSDSDYEPHILITYVDGDKEGEIIFEDTVELEDNSGVNIWELTSVPGDYDVRVEVENVTVERRWTYDPDDFSNPSVYILNGDDDDDVRILIWPGAPDPTDAA